MQSIQFLFIHVYCSFKINQILFIFSDFEEMSIGVLNIFDSTTDDLINGVILLRKIPFYNLDCLQMAVESDCQKFVALSSVQNLLTGIWYGKIVSKSGVKAGIRVCLLFIDSRFL